MIDPLLMLINCGVTFYVGKDAVQTKLVSLVISPQTLKDANQQKWDILSDIAI